MRRRPIRFMFFLLLAAASAVVFSQTAPCLAVQNESQPATAPPTRAVSRPVVTVGEETTVVAEPLRPDGYVDYVAALNKRCSEGVTPENNAAVLLVRVFGPRHIAEASRERFFQMLGIDPLPEQGDYVVTSNEFERQLEAEAGPARRKPETEDEDASFSDQLRTAMRRPWSEQEFPQVARWLKSNEKPLPLIVEATGRSRFYAPLVTGSENPMQDMLVSVLLPLLQQSRDAARLLASRAMLHLNNGEAEKAWADLLACHRLARLCDQDPTLIGALVSIAIDGIACSGDAALIQYGQLRPEQTGRILADMRGLAPPPRVADKIDIAERYMFIDCVCTIARGDVSPGQLGSSAPSAGGAGASAMAERVFKAAAGILVDWDRILRIGNSYYDRMVAAMRRPTHAERVRAMRAVEEDIKSAVDKVRDPWRIAKSFLSSSPRAAASENMANVLIALLLPAVSAARKAEDRGTATFRLAQVGIALGGYRSDHGGYPDTLAQLVPQYVAELPKDPFTDQEFRYQRTPDGFLIYSLGPNMEDNQGRVDYLDRETAPAGADVSQWDDYRLRVPVQVD